jgi:hypothetical protein
MIDYLCVLFVGVDSRNNSVTGRTGKEYRKTVLKLSMEARITNGDIYR